MRLNFSGVGEDDLREGVRRIGKVIAEQVQLYSTLTETPPEPARRPEAAARGRRRADRAAAAPRRMSRVVVLEGGRSLERQVSLRSGARVRDALEALGHDVIGVDVGPDLVARLTDTRPDVAFVALHGRDGEDGTVQEILELVGVPYTASGPSACMRCMDKVLAKHTLRDAGLPTPDFYAFSQTAFDSLGAAQALPAIEERLDFPVVVKPAAQGSALGIRFAPTAEEVPAAIVAAFSYDTKVLLERHVAGRELAVSVIDGRDGPEATARRGSDPARRRSLRLRGPLRDRPHRLRVPGRPGAGHHARRAGAGAGDLPSPRLLRLRPRRPHARDGYRRAHGARGQRDPGSDRDLAAAARGRGRRA